MTMSGIAVIRSGGCLEMSAPKVLDGIEGLGRGEGCLPQKLLVTI